MSTLQISKKLNRDHRTIKKAAKNILHKCVRSKGWGFKHVTEWNKRQLKQILSNHPLLTSAAVFDKACLTNIKRDKRCRILRTFGYVRKSCRRRPLTQIHKGKRLQWAQDNIKIDFSKVIFTDESRWTLDGPGGWSKGWILDDRTAPITKRRQQDGGGIVIWTGIVGNKLIGPFKVDDGVTLTSETYCKFLSNTFFKWYRSQKRSSKANYVFMHENAPSHAANATTQFLAKKRISVSKLMQWPPARPDLNPIDNL